ncbi:putative ribonuclease H protein, partial [Trifolium medium]|nr:putative ribonuclease H protein [Trifolium medium]
GASKGIDGLSGCGGLVRDENGRWVAGFTRNLGTTSAYMAELWGGYS